MGLFPIFKEYDDMKKNLPIFEISQEALNFSVTLISCLQKMIEVSFLSETVTGLF